MNGAGGILIVGGYGHVGGRIAANLLRLGLGPVLLSGRDVGKAREAAESLGCEARYIDLAEPQSWDGALAGVDAVIGCVDPQDAGFAAHVLTKSLTYVDVTASDGFFRQVEKLDSLARDKGGRAILSVGLAPGLTNLLVRACVETMDRAESAQIGIMLGLGDEHGAAAIDWTLAGFRSAGRMRERIETIAFGAPPRDHPAMVFDFADQYVVRRTLGLAEARTLLTFDSAALGRLLLAVLPRIAASPMLSSVVRKSMRWLRFGSDRAALTVTVSGYHGGRPATASAVLEGRKEAEITALVAALVVKHAQHAGLAPGVRHIEQVLSIEALAPALREHGVRIELPRRPVLDDGVR
ncbi:MAG: hypothetical protein M9955_22440 [Rhizobiaceae bacterium]|nr:hypothetical protein [Rhizobiaceae bacterium]